MESYLRNLFAWGPQFEVKVGPVSDAPAADLYRVPIRVTFEGDTDDGVVYVTKDGKYIFRGEIRNMADDPFAENRKKLQAENLPAIGPADAKVKVVIFSDFECPHCRQLADTLKSLEHDYPQVRFEFRDFPLTQLHPWAMSAAVAARCAFQAGPDKYERLHDLIFEHQDDLNADNAWDNLQQYAKQSGLEQAWMQSCMASDATRQQVEDDLQVGTSLKIESTPTLFVNGRELVGGDPQTLKQFIDFELLAGAPANKGKD